MKLVEVCTTLDDGERARLIARTVVERRLAACAQIATVDSIYRWDGALCETPEFRITMKTAAASAAALQAAVRALHPYELPEILARPLDCDDPAYAAWVVDNSAGG